MDITAKRIRELRKASKMSQEELAKLVGYSGRSAVCLIEKNSMEMAIDKLMEIAMVFDVPVSYLLGMDDLNEKKPIEQLCYVFEQLNDEGQHQIIEYAEMLSINPKYKKV